MFVSLLLQVINFYLSLVKQRADREVETAKAAGAPTMPVHMFSSFFFTKVRCRVVSCPVVSLACHVVSVCVIFYAQRSVFPSRVTVATDSASMPLSRCSPWVIHVWQLCDHPSGYQYANVRRWTNRPSYVDIFTFDRVVAPINVSNVSVLLDEHTSGVLGCGCVMVVDRRSRSVACPRVPCAVPLVFGSDLYENQGDHLLRLHERCGASVSREAASVRGCSVVCMCCVCVVWPYVSAVFLLPSSHFAVRVCRNLFLCLNRG